MSADSDPNDKKKDLTGIFPLPEDPAEGSSSQDNQALESPAAPGQSLTEEDLFPPTEPLPPDDPSFSSVDKNLFGTSAEQAHDSEGGVTHHEDQLAGDPVPASPSPAEPPTIEKKEATLSSIKTFSEKAPAPAAYPFTVTIVGPLTPYEQEKLTDLITREKLGISEADLAPQWDAQRILIPRISEYAAVLIVQALRGCSADIQARPSDEAEKQTHIPTIQTSTQLSSTHPADQIVVSTEDQIPGHTHLMPIDTLSASGLIQSQFVEIDPSPEYQTMVDTLQRELKYKAFVKKASALVSFKIQLTPVSPPTHYRITVTALAVR